MVATGRLSSSQGVKSDSGDARNSNTIRMSDLVTMSAEHGPIFAASLSTSDPSPSVVIADAALAHEICVKKSSTYTRVMQQYSAVAPLLGSTALVLQQGVAHRSMRNRLLPLFQPAQADRVFEQVRIAVHELVQGWADLPERACTTLKRDMEICVVQAALGCFFGAAGDTSESAVPRQRVSTLVESVKIAMKALVGEGDDGEDNAHPRAYGSLWGAVQHLFGHRAEVYPFFFSFFSETRSAPSEHRRVYAISPTLAGPTPGRACRHRRGAPIVAGQPAGGR